MRSKPRSHPLAKRRRSWWQRLVLTVGSLLVLSTSSASGVVYWFWHEYQSIDRFDNLETDVVQAGEPENFLVVGSDSRANESEAERASEGTTRRSDTIMVVRIDPEAKAAQALSFQRDLMVEIAGTEAVDKINSAFTEGPQRLIDTLRQNFDILIHHVVEIDFQGFRRLVDQVGGVELYFDHAVRDQRVGLYQVELGCQMLNGEEALAFARTRKLQYMTDDGWKDDQTSDHGRITRQQILVRQAVDKAVQQARSDPVQLAELVDVVADTITLSESLGAGDLLDLARQFRDFTTEGLTMYAMPIVEVGEVGEADLYPDWDAAEPLLNVFRGLPPGEIGPRRIKVTVLNGTGVPQQASNVAGALQVIGFRVGEPGDAEPVQATIIFHASGEEAIAQRVARHLESGARITPRHDVPSGEVLLVTGPDFTRVHEYPAPLGETTISTAPAGGATASSSGPATTAAVPPPPTEPIGYAVGLPPPGTECSESPRLRSSRRRGGASSVVR